MDKMYKTVQAACRMAIKAHNKEKRYHVIFKEMGLFRIKPVDEIAEIDQKSIYGWTYSVWYEWLNQEMTWEEQKKKFPYGDDARIRKQFYKGDCYYDPSIIAYHPERIGLKLYNKYTKEEIYHCIINGQGL